MEEGKGGSRGIGWLEVRNTLVQLQERGRKERCGAEKGQKRREECMREKRQLWLAADAAFGCILQIIQRRKEEGGEK